MRNAQRLCTAPLLGVALAAQVVSASAAGSIAYNYLDAAYLSTSPDSGDEDSKGYQATLSAPLEAGNFMRAYYARSKGDTGDSDSILSGGLGAYTPWQAGVDGYLLISYEKHKRAGVKEDGYAGEVGLRWLFSDALEVNGGGVYRKLDDSGESVTWFGGLNFEFSPGMALTGRYENAEGETRYTVGLRFLPR